MFLVSESLFLMPKFEQKLCFGLLQLKKLKKLHFLAKNPISPYILCLALKCTKIVFGDVLDRKKKHFQTIKRHISYKVANWIFRNGLSHDFGKRIIFYHSLFFAHSFNIKCHKIVFVDVLDGQTAFLDYKKYRPYYTVDKLVFCKEADTRKLKKWDFS